MAARGIERSEMEEAVESSGGQKADVAVEKFQSALNPRQFLA